MISPDKYTDIDTCILRIAGEIVTCLKQEPRIAINDLDNRISDICGETARVNYVLALSFLYILGKADYQQHNDSICLQEYRGQS